MNLSTTACQKQWERIGIKHHHGIALPLFSLHTEASCGIGEFLDLIPLLEWSHHLKLSVIQLLPLNDTGKETSPYNSLSAFALNPVHISLSQLPHLNSDLIAWAKDLTRLNQSQHIDYGHVFESKREFTYVYWQTGGQEIANTSDYNHFVAENGWLQGYALFKALKEMSHWSSFDTWPADWRDPTKFEELLSRNRAQVDYHIFVQYLCHMQFKQVSDRAKQLGIHLMGDIPILISPDSADVWQHPELFLTDFAAGAPPDMYSQSGQYWGFPLYNWHGMEQEGYSWWKQRLKCEEQYCTLYRIDHIVGFFRIWSIPKGRPATEGYFSPQDELTWIGHGSKILQMMIDNSSMLPIGEDLGTIPPSVRVCLHQMGICGTKVMRWERRWHGDLGFVSPKDYPADSLCCVSTHDSDTLSLWWEHEHDNAIRYCAEKGWVYLPYLTHDQRFEILRECHTSGSLFHVNLLQEYLAFFPDLVWPNPQEERINVPGTINPQNWSYRFRPSIETIVHHIELNNVFNKLIE